MTISDRVTQARHDRSARQAVRSQREALARELAGYTTAAERMEIQVLASQHPGPDADLVLELLDQASSNARYAGHRAL